MINFIIPGLYEHYKINLILCQLLKFYPEMFYDDINISSVYGNFQFCTWDGGRIFENYSYTTKEEMEKIIKSFNELGVRTRYVFTSPTIIENEIYNRFNNLALALAETENKFNEIVVNSPILENYILENYPNFNLISSTTKCLLDLNKVREEILNSKYSMVCLDYNLNKNIKFLNNLTYQEKEKVEFLVNAICPPGCPYRKNHYKLNGIFGKTYGKRYSMNGCMVDKSTLYPNNFYNNLEIEDIYNYHKEGFFYYKLEGRSFDKYELVFNYLKYLVKPEYQAVVGKYLFVQEENFNFDAYSSDLYSFIIPR